MLQCCEFICPCILYLQVYHPNIDLEGNVCLNILREDWKPVLNINTVIYGLYHLFTVWLCFLKYHGWYLKSIKSNLLIICRSQITRIPWIMMQLPCWEITQRCLNLMWGGQCLVGMWGKPFSHAVCKPCSTTSKPCLKYNQCFDGPWFVKFIYQNCILLSSVCYFSGWREHQVP